MRAFAAIALLLAFIVVGCGSEMPKLQARVKGATPAGRRSAGACAGSEAFIESAWVKCIFVVRGTRESAIAQVSNRLRKRGFRLGCEDALGALNLVAVRGRTRLIATARPGAITFDESDGGKPLDIVDARFAPPGSRRIPSGSVGLKISTDTLSAASPLPYPLPVSSCPS